MATSVSMIAILRDLFLELVVWSSIGKLVVEARMSALGMNWVHENLVEDLEGGLKFDHLELHSVASSEVDKIA